MDLNIGNYSSGELFNLLYLPVKNTYTLEDLRDATIEKLEIIISSKDKNVDKNSLFNFYKEVFTRLANILDLNIPQYIRDELETRRKGLLPKLENNTIFKQSNNFVVKHNDMTSINTFPSHLKAGVINPLKRKNMVKLLNINTRFRTNYNKTSSTDFIFSLPYTIKKVMSLKLVDFEFCNSVYNFSTFLNNNTFTISVANKTPQLVTIIDGSYSPKELETYLNTILLNGVKVIYDTINGKFYFYGTPYFDIDFTPVKNHCSKTYHGEICKKQLSAGWIMGYRKTKYFWDIPKDISSGVILPSSPNTTISNVYLPEAPFDCKGTRYFLMSINDYNNNHGSTIISPFKEDMLADNNVLAKIPYKGNPFAFNVEDSCCRYIKREYFGPVNLNRFDIKIYDEYGRIIDVNNVDYSLSFELEILYDL